MEEVLEVLMLPNDLNLLLCSEMLIGPTQTFSHAAYCFFPPSFNFGYLLSSFITYPAVLDFTNEQYPSSSAMQNLLC